MPWQDPALRRWWNILGPVRSIEMLNTAIESIATPSVLVVTSTASVIGSRSTSVKLRAECQHGRSWHSCGRLHLEILSCRHQGLDVGEVRRSERVAEERTWSRSIGEGPIPRSCATASNIISATLADAQGSDHPAAALAAPSSRGLASLHYRVDLAWHLARGTGTPHSTVPSPSCVEKSKTKQKHDVTNLCTQCG